MTVSLDQLMDAIRSQESGGNYSVVNSIGATGAYQVMPANIPAWTQAALGRRMTQAEFRANPAAQDQTVRKILGGYYDKYGPAGAAAMWYSGQPNPNSQASSPGAPTVQQYVNQVLGRAAKVTNADFTIPFPGTDGLTIPTPGNPLDLPGKAAGAIWGQVQPFALTSLFAVGGLALVVIGVTVTAKQGAAPVQAKADDAKQQLLALKGGGK